MGISLLAGIASSFLFEQDFLMLIVLALIHSTFFYRGIMYADQSWNDLLPKSVMQFGGFGAYFVSYFMFRYTKKLTPYLTLVTICGALVIISTLLVTNHFQLKSSTLSKRESPYISQSMKKQNLFYSVLTVVVIFLFMSTKAMWTGLWQGFVNLVQGSGSKTGSNPAVGEAPPQTMPDLGLPLDVKEPSRLGEILDTVLMYFGYALITLIVLVGLLFLMKKTRSWVKKVFRIITSFFHKILKRSVHHEENAGYVDVKENLFDWKEWSTEQNLKAKKFIKNTFKRKPRWDSLSNQMKVRFVYKEFISKKLNEFPYRDAYTPRENLSELVEKSKVNEEKIAALNDAYEQVRYGLQDVEQQKLDDLYLLIKEK